MKPVMVSPQKEESVFDPKYLGLRTGCPVFATDWVTVA